MSEKSAIEKMVEWLKLSFTNDGRYVGVTDFAQIKNKACTLLAEEKAQKPTAPINLLELKKWVIKEREDHASNDQLLDSFIIALCNKIDEITIHPVESEGLREALEEISKLENKYSNAWSGGIGEASMVDIENIGKISRRLLSQHAAPVEPHSVKNSCFSCAYNQKGESICTSCQGFSKHTPV